MKEPVRISLSDLPSTVLEAVRRYMAQHWPDLAGANPTITRRDQPSVAYTLTYRASMSAADGQTISRTVRLTVDAQGKVLKSVSPK
jgi:hypothetical protein